MSGPLRRVLERQRRAFATVAPTLENVPGPLATHVVRRRADGACFPARIVGEVLLVEYRGAWIRADALPDPERAS